MTGRVVKESAALEGRFACVGTWGTQAACKDVTETMEMPNGRGNATTAPARARISHAKTICHHCPVEAECRAWALTTPDPAIGMLAGGLTPDERARLRNRQRPC